MDRAFSFSRWLSKNLEAKEVAVTDLTFSSMSLPSMVESLRAMALTGADLVGSKSKKIAVKITHIAIQSSCSEKIPLGFSATFSGRSNMFEAK